MSFIIGVLVQQEDTNTNVDTLNQSTVDDDIQYYILPYSEIDTQVFLIEMIRISNKFS